MALDVQALSLNGSAPHCEHLDALVPVDPLGSVCRECRAAGEDWVGLLVCLTCAADGRRVIATGGSPRRLSRLGHLAYGHVADAGSKLAVVDCAHTGDNHERLGFSPENCGNRTPQRSVQ
jgi:hypothetical protein